MKKVALQYYQMVLLDHVFRSHDIPVGKLCWSMRAFLPSTFNTFEFAAEYVDKDAFKREIIRAGSSGFEALVDACEKADLKDLVQELTDHKQKPLYRYVWIWSEDNSIMKRGNSWYQDKQECREEGERCRPSYATWDGPNSPTAVLSVEAVCGCLVTGVDQRSYVIERACSCHPHLVPEQYRNQNEIWIDGLTIVKLPMVGFSAGGSYFYVVKETQDRFSSSKWDIFTAYCEYRRELIMASFGQSMYDFASFAK